MKFHANLAVKDSIGGWKDNAHIFKFPNACSSMKNAMTTQWPEFLRKFNITNTNCPIAPASDMCFVFYV